MAALLTLTGCASAPGFLSAMYDSQDLCQRTELIERGQYPSYCGAGASRYVTRDYTTGRYLTVTKVQK